MTKVLDNAKEFVLLVDAEEFSVFLVDVEVADKLRRGILLDAEESSRYSSSSSVLME